MVRLKQLLALVLVWGIVFATSPIANASGAGVPLPQQDAAPASIPPSQIDSLTAPIALYPDALVAQVLAASTYPNEVVEAHQWLKDNSSLQGNTLANQVNQQSWDPSVKALTQFPSVLDNMANNLSWTSALGDEFYNQQADVMASVQRLRQQAQAAGNLKSNSQMTVTQQSPQTIVIAPANPQIVYVPTYSPTVVYGTPYYPPGYSTGAVVATGLISFGVGMAVGAAISNSWGWNNWNCGWHGGGTVVYNRNVYVSRSNVYANGNRYHNGSWTRPTPYGANNYNRNNNNNNNYNNRSGNRNTNVSNNTVNINNSGNRNQNVDANNDNRNNDNSNRPNQGNGANQNNRPQNNPTKPANSTYRGYGQSPSPGTKSGAFSGYSTGGNARADSDRGRSSYGGVGNRDGGGGRRR